LENWKTSLQTVLEMSPEHLSLYPLDIEKKTAFYFEGVNVDQELQAEMHDWASETIEGLGFEHYEIFSYALPGRQCRHNLKYWRNEPCLGIGLSAAGYDGNRRYQNTDRFWNYIEAIESGSSPVAESENLSHSHKLREEMMLGLRLKEGIPLTQDIRQTYGSVLDQLVKEECLHLADNGSQLVSTSKGWLLSNHIYRSLIGNLV